MRKTWLVLSVTLVMVPFQNCAKASFGISDTYASLAGQYGPTVCVDFGGGTTSCSEDHAFVGNLYVEPRSTLIARSHGGGTVMAGPHAALDALMQDEWLQGSLVGGVLQPYRLVTSSFDLTGQFTNNFHTVDGRSIEVPDADGNNETVSAWFALSMSANFHLDRTDAGGADYQFAVVSDDGAQLLYRPAGQAGYQLLVDNQTPESSGDGFYIPGTQFVRMGCGATLNDVTSVVTFRGLAASATIPLRLNYFNGPQGLTLHLLYRRVPAAGPVDPSCETDANAGDHKASTVKPGAVFDYAPLAARGWKVVGAANL